MDKFSVLRLITVVLAVNLLACTTPPKTAPDPGSPVAEFPVMSIGDTWVSSHYSNTHGTAIFTYQVTSVDPDGSFDIKQENDKSIDRNFVHFDATANGVPMTMGNDYDLEALQFPLFVGKAWETEARTKSSNGDTYTYKTWYVVNEYTTIETDAGSFDAFLIRSKISNLDASWTGISNYWYAPQARAIVKTTHTHLPGLEVLKVDLVE